MHRLGRLKKILNHQHKRLLQSRIQRKESLKSLVNLRVLETRADIPQNPMMKTPTSKISQIDIDTNL
jgi:hypothetical protein